MVSEPAGPDISKLQKGFWNPQYHPPSGTQAKPRQRASSMSNPGLTDQVHHLPKPRRTMSVSCKDKDPITRPRMSSSNLQLITEDQTPPRPRSFSFSGPLLRGKKKNITVDETYSSPKDFTSSISSGPTAWLCQRSRSSSTSSSSSGPGSPASHLTSASSEQFWKQYKRTPSVVKSLSSFGSLSLNDSGVESDLALSCSAESDQMEAELGDRFEPLYSEIYSSAKSPPLPEKASSWRPPARPPYPASSLLSKQKKMSRNRK